MKKILLIALLGIFNFAVKAQPIAPQRLTITSACYPVYVAIYAIAYPPGPTMSCVSLGSPANMEFSAYITGPTTFDNISAFPSTTPFYYCSGAMPSSLNFYYIGALVTPSCQVNFKGIVGTTGSGFPPTNDFGGCGPTTCPGLSFIGWTDMGWGSDATVLLH